MALFSRRRKNASMVDVDRVLQSISVLNHSERQHVLGLFQRYRTNGISRGELRDVVRRMKLDVEDDISPVEAKRIRRALLKLF